MGMLSEVKTTSTVGRSLQVLLLALAGLTVYVAALALVVGFCALLLSGYVHAVQTTVPASPQSASWPAPHDRSCHLVATDRPCGESTPDSR